MTLFQQTQPSTDFFEKLIVTKIKQKLKLSHFTPRRRLEGEEI
jgi:hypothetical protein